MTAFRTIGIDASLTNTGQCYVSKNGDGATVRQTIEVVPKGSLKAHSRLDFIDREVREFMLTYPADLVVIEGYDYKGFSLVPLAEINGILQLTAWRLCGNVIHAAPSQVKKFAVGKPQASKAQIMKHFGLDNEHIADARALAEIGQVFLGAPSKRRCELEVAMQLRDGPKKKGLTSKRVGKSKPYLVSL